MKTSVLIIAYNRPNLLKNLLRNPNLNFRTVYIAIDGAKDNNQEELKLVESCKRVASEFKLSRVTFKTELKFQNVNKGISKAVISAINWAFESEEALIIIEDDILPSKDFFFYMDYYLSLFQLDKKIWHISGHNPNPRTKKLKYPYLSIFPMIWGWGTWKDRWALYDPKLIFSPNPFPVTLQSYIPGQILEAEFTEYWENRILRIRNGFNTWDVQWGLSMWRQRAFAIMPSVNLTLNKGIGSEATNTRGRTVFNVKKNFSGKKLRLIPNNLIQNEWQDVVTWKYVFGRTNQMSLYWRAYIKFYKKCIESIERFNSHYFSKLLLKKISKIQ